MPLGEHWRPLPQRVVECFGLCTGPHHHHHRIYPTCTGSEHMRSLTRLPEGMKMFAEYLREVGYYTSNNFKEDYNVEKPGRPWDDSGRNAHWRNRGTDQPFFSVFNLEITHESQIRTRPHKGVHNPAGVRIPPYHPDTPELRQGWAQYYDNITTMDTQAARILTDLRQDGLADSTIIFFYGDHGSGMPRHKRCAYNSGLRVPMSPHSCSLWKTGAAGTPPGRRAGPVRQVRRPCSDGSEPRRCGAAGVYAGRSIRGTIRPARATIHVGFRGRMDERYDLIRSVRDRRYIYVRNYMLHKPLGQHVGFLPEDELHGRSGPDAPSTMGHDDKRYPLERVLAAATLASERNIRSTPELVEALKDADSAVRYWAVIGLLIRGRASVEAARPALVAALADAAPSVRIAVAEGSGQHGRSEDLTRVLEVVMAAAPPDKNGVYVSMQALNAIDALGPNADAIRERVSAILPEDPRSPERTRTNIPKLLRHIAGQKRAGPRV